VAEQTDLKAIRRSSSLSGRRITADYVAEALRDAILTGRLPDGAVLKQAAIAEHLGVSRVPVREAMRELQAEGLVQTQAHHIAVVPSLSLQRIGELYEYRALIEAHMAERAVPRLDKADVKALKAKNKEMAATADHSRWLQLNAEFHEIILAKGGDETGLELVRQLRTKAERYVRMWSRGQGVRRPKEVRREHAAIIADIEAGDATAVAEAIRDHILHTGERLMGLQGATDAAAVAASGPPER
jgi:DNA-binding GntR family transcriptional regulator